MARTPYNGISQKLVLAFDIGTTYSSAAYAFLEPGSVPQIQCVTKYLDNPNVGSGKVPSISYYDRDGNFRGVENGTGPWDGENLIQMKWWKLLLEPTDPHAALRNHMTANLLAGKTIVDIFSDFMRYLFDSTKASFISGEKCGDICWDSVSRDIELVLTHPNGWGGLQQSQLRTAAVRANIVPSTPEGHARVHFVTEGEAIFDFCAARTQFDDDIKRGDSVLVVHAGEETIDISSYTVTNDGLPLQVEELFQPKCLLQGGGFVTARAREIISEKLRKSRFNTAESTAAIAQSFDGGLKKVFSDEAKTHYIKFGSIRDDDPQHGIKTGKLMVTGREVSEFFEPSIRSTVDSIRENFAEIISKNSFVFLIGTLASSPWLSSQLNRRLSNLGLKFLSPDGNADTAVAVGAASHHIDRLINGRISRFTYGTSRSAIYLSQDPEHITREHKSFVDELEDKWVPDAFTTMLSKGTKICESKEIRTEMRVLRKVTPATSAFAEIIKYDGSEGEPKWMDVDRNRFETVCHVVADISTAPYTTKVGTSGKVCYYREYEVVFFVGLTDLKAQICWRDSATGLEKSGDAVIVYNDASENSYVGPTVNPPPRYGDWDL